MIRTKGEPGTGDVVQAVRHMRAMNAEIRRIQNLDRIHCNTAKTGYPLYTSARTHQTSTVHLQEPVGICNRLISDSCI